MLAVEVAGSDVVVLRLDLDASAVPFTGPARGLPEQARPDFLPAELGGHPKVPQHRQILPSRQKVQFGHIPNHNRPAHQPSARMSLKHGGITKVPFHPLRGMLMGIEICRYRRRQGTKPQGEPSAFSLADLVFLGAGELDRDLRVTIQIELGNALHNTDTQVHSGLHSIEPYQFGLLPGTR